MVGVTGLEPVTPGPPDQCATNCATPRIEQNPNVARNATRTVQRSFFRDFNSFRISRNSDLSV